MSLLLYAFRRCAYAFILSVVILPSVFLMGCATAHFDLASQPVIIHDQLVTLSPLEVYVFPEGQRENPPTALFIPFRVTQPITDPTVIGQNVSYMIWQHWVQEKTFPVLEFSQTGIPYRPDVALNLAARKGADMVVGGYITYLSDGGTVGDTRLSLTVEIYDVQSGMLMWSMAQGALMTQEQRRDYLLLAVESRLPGDPFAATVAAISKTMAQKVRDWVGAAEQAFPPPTTSSTFSNEPSAF